MKKKQFNRFVLLLSAIFLGMHQLEADAQQTLMTLMGNRSSGYTVKNGTGDKFEIDAKTQLILASKGRAWFKSAQVSDDNELTLICQNNSSEDVVMEFSASQWPWLNPVIYPVCSGWLNHKLVCQIGDNANDVLSCGTLKRTANPFSNGKIERRTSVTMRSVLMPNNGSQLTEQSKKEFIAEIKTELQLCKKVNDYPASVDLFWRIRDGEYHYLEVMLDDTPANRNLSQCFDSVLKGYSFKTFPDEQQFDLTL